MVQIYNEVCDDLLARSSASAGDRVSALSAGRGMKVVQAPGCTKEGGWEMEGLSWLRCKSPEHLLVGLRTYRVHSTTEHCHSFSHSSSVPFRSLLRRHQHQHLLKPVSNAPPRHLLPP